MSAKPEASYDNFTTLRNAIVAKDFDKVNRYLNRFTFDEINLDAALILACEKSTAQIVQLLLANGANVHTCENRPIKRAFCRGKREIINVLRNYMQINEELANELLLEIYDDDHCHNFIEMVQILIDSGLDVDMFLGHAITNGETEFATLLLDNGADPNKIKMIHETPYTQLELAAQNLHFAIIPKLIEKGATQKDEALMVVIGKLEDYSPDEMSKIFQTIEVLINNGAVASEVDIEFVLQKILEASSATLGNDLVKGRYLLDILQMLLPTINSLPDEIIEEIRKLELLLQGANFIDEDEEYEVGINMESENFPAFVQGVTGVMNALHHLEQRMQGPLAARRERALQQEEENKERRRLALEEYKSSISENNSEIENVKVHEHCYADSTIMGDSLKDSDDFVVFLIDAEGKKGDCYLREELKELQEHAEEVYEFSGPPYGFTSPDDYKGPRGPDFDKPVIKLPWSGIWVDGDLFEKAIIGPENQFHLYKRKQSIGNRFEISGLHGQFGGHWRVSEDGDSAVYVRDGNAVPDERPYLYSYRSGEVI